MGKGVFRKIIKGGGLEMPNAVRQSGLTSSPKKTARMSSAELIRNDAEEQVESIQAYCGHDSQKKDGAPAPHTDIVNAAPPILGADAAGEPAPSLRPKDDAQKREGAYSTVYGDVEVCRLLKIRRRKIAEARTKQTRGVDWDCVGLHAGMTMKWIQETAIKQGTVPDFFNVPLTPIKENDGVVSCKLLGTWPNRTKVTVEVVATGEVKVATVRDANEFHLYDIFDARDYGREIQWTAELNSAVY